MGEAFLFRQTSAVKEYNGTFSVNNYNLYTKEEPYEIDVGFVPDVFVIYTEDYRTGSFIRAIFYTPLYTVFCAGYGGEYSGDLESWITFDGTTIQLKALSNYSDVINLSGNYQIYAVKYT